MTLAELKARAGKLGITEADVQYHFGSTKKKDWELAISSKEKAQANAALAIEAEEENRKVRVAQAYQSASAPIVVPVAFGLAVGTVLVRNVSGMLARH